MNVIAIANQKGGCGKTTTTINLAAGLARQDARVLILDMDPQGHSALGLGAQDHDSAGLYEVLAGQITLPEVIIPEVSPGVDLAPGSISLAAVEHVLANQPERERQLAHHLELVEDHYDYIIIDCPPSMGLLAINALRAADQVIIPVEPGLFSLDGIERLRELIQMLNEKYARDLRVRVLANMVDMRTRMSRELISHITERFPDEVCDAHIRHTVLLREASCRGMAVVDFAPRATVSEDFRQLTREIIDTMPGITGIRTEPPTNYWESITSHSNAYDGTRPETNAMQKDTLNAQKDEEDEDMPIGIQKVVLSYQDLRGKHVQIAGDFNNWMPDEGVQTRMFDGTLEKILEIPPGNYEYSIIINGVWQTDPNNPNHVPNEFGSENSLLKVQ